MKKLMKFKLNYKTKLETMKNNIKVARSYSESQKQRLEDLKNLELAQRQEKELNKKVKYLLKNQFN